MEEVELGSSDFQSKTVDFIRLQRKCCWKSQTMDVYFSHSEIWCYGEKPDFLWHLYLIAHFLETRKKLQEFFLLKIGMTEELPLC